MNNFFRCLGRGDDPPPHNHPPDRSNTQPPDHPLSQPLSLSLSPSLSLSLPLSPSQSSSSATPHPPTSPATIDSLTAQVSAISLARESDYAELNAKLTKLEASSESGLSTLADKFAQMEHSIGAAITEVLRENRELRAENVRLSAQIRSSEVTTQLDGTSASLPPISPTVGPPPPAVNVSSSVRQEAVSPPNKWSRGNNLRSLDQLKQPDRLSKLFAFYYYFNYIIRHYNF